MGTWSQLTVFFVNRLGVSDVVAVAGQAGRSAGVADGWQGAARVACSCPLTWAAASVSSTARAGVTGNDATLPTPAGTGGGRVTHARELRFVRGCCCLDGVASGGPPGAPRRRGRSPGWPSAWHLRLLWQGLFFVGCLPSRRPPYGLSHRAKGAHLLAFAATLVLWPLRCFLHGPLDAA
jgi:hypothetical protein